jgi:TP53 regulating kinase and related kinases
MTDTTTTTTTDKPPFEPQSSWTLLSQGAEARIWKIPATDREPAKIAKERFSKAYRHPTLDEKLTKSRCRAEGRILEKCRTPKAPEDAIDVPRVIRVDPPILYLEWIDGKTVREYLEDHVLVHEHPPDDELNRLAQQMGTMIGRLHKLGCIHGDLTTSNMMLRDTSHKRSKPNQEEPTVVPHHHHHHLLKSMTLIDFGLAKSTTSAEERAVDLYVLERALTSTHPKLPTTFFPALLEAYKPWLDSKAADAALQRLEQVRLRGRKRECFG